MAYAPSTPSSAAVPARGGASYKPPAPSSTAPQGTFLPGTKVQVGSHRVVIEKYLSEGGFAHVYVVRVPRDNNRHELAVLKRVAVPDKDHLANMRTEVETMKKLQGHKHVVKYMDSHASQLKGTGYEVFLLMEYCSGGGLIDFMNTRLQHRLTEPEILKIFGDTAEGVACMHYLKPPLLHRDLKVENVLIAKSASSGAPTYKLCDFGSAAPPRPAAKTTEEGHLIEEDVQKHTTMQYRSPEMIDVWRRQPIDEKADIWALGVFLYKLCYYTTPFEGVGQMAILNASFKYPSYPSFSERLMKLIGSMLKEDPKKRPTIYDVIKEVCSMQGTEVPLKDIYAQRTQSQARRNEELPSPVQPMSIGLQKQAPEAQGLSIPDIAPMRRGRPIAPVQQAAAASNKPSPSPARGDPFAALDSKNYDVRVGAVDELSKKYPSLNEFSITHDKGGEFSFPPPRTSSKPTDATAAPTKQNDLNERVANALADEAFKQPKVTVDMPKSQSSTQLGQTNALPSKGGQVKVKTSELTKPSPIGNEATPVASGLGYTSTGTGASPPPSAIPKVLPDRSHRSIWRVPDHHRSSSQPRASQTAQAAAASLQPSLPPTQRPAVLDLHRSKAQIATMASNALSPTSSRPSLEGHRPTQMELGEPLARAKSATFRPRPTSAYVSSNMDYLKDQEHPRKRLSGDHKRHSRDMSQDRGTDDADTPILDDMEYLRRNEDLERKGSHKHSLHRKHGSRHSNSVAGAKNILTGRFGDAFKRFERRSSEEEAGDAGFSRTELQYDHNDDEPRLLSPILGSEATRSVRSDNESAIDETEDLPPDVRRELERRRLDEEEGRVAAAAAEYRSRVTEPGTGGSSAASSKASTIQKRVQTLLDEVGQSSALSKRTAEGYGQYTEMSDEDLATHDDGVKGLSKPKAAPPRIATKPTITSPAPSNPYSQARPPIPEPLAKSLPVPSASAPPTQPVTPQQRVASRPSVPPKAPSLRTGGGVPRQQWPPGQSDTQPSTSSKPTGGLAALLAKDLEGVPDYPPHDSNALVSSPVANGKISAHEAGGEAEDFEADFSKRYPSLSGIEMVETEIGGHRTVLKGREV